MKTMDPRKTKMPKMSLTSTRRIGLTHIGWHTAIAVPASGGGGGEHRGGGDAPATGWTDDINDIRGQIGEHLSQVVAKVPTRHRNEV